MRDILVDGRHFVVKEGQDVDRVIEGLRAKGKTVVKCKKPPTIKTMMKWMDDGWRRPPMVVGWSQMAPAHTATSRGS